jgi:hypothetical protein
VGEAGYVATRQIRRIEYKTELGPHRRGTAGQQLNKFGRTANNGKCRQWVEPLRFQATLQKRFAGGYSFYAAYTFGKAISASGLDTSDSTLGSHSRILYIMSVSGFDRHTICKSRT